MTSDQLQDWEALSPEDRDLFKNPHQKSSSAEFSVPGFGLRDRALAVVGKLNREGKVKALAALNEATATLDEYRRPYPPDVDAIKSNLRKELGLE